MPNKTERRELDYILDIYEKIERIESKMKNKTYREFYEDSDLNEIINYNIMIIGEAISNIEMRTLLKYNSDKKYWINIKGTRNILIHEYHGVDFKLLYKIATDLIEDLKSYILKMIEDRMEEIENN